MNTTGKGRDFLKMEVKEKVSITHIWSFSQAYFEPKDHILGLNEVKLSEKILLFNNWVKIPCKKKSSIVWEMAW